jgi:RHS repeat-associated protein
LTYTFAADNRTITKVTATDALGDVTETDIATMALPAPAVGTFQVPTQHTARRRAMNGQPYDQVSRMVYDATGNLQSATAAYGTALAETATFAYGSPLAPAAPTTATDSLGRTVTFAFDPSGRLVRSFSPENLVVPVGHPDRAPSMTTLEYNADGLPRAMVDPLGRRVEIAYRGLPASRLEVITWRIVDGASTTMLLDADGNVLSASGVDGIRSELHYNGDGAVLSVTEAVGRPEARTTRYEYDLNGDLTALIPPKGEAGKVQFDYRRYDQNGVLQNPPGGIYEGQLTRILHPDATAEYFGYNDAGEPAWQSRPHAGGWSTITYERDALHRVVRVVTPTSAQGVPGFTAETVFDEFGRALSTTDGTGTTSVVYDVLDRPVAVTASGGRKDASFTYLKDPVYKRWISRTTLAGVGTWEEREDTKGRPSGVLNPFGQAFSTEYNSAGEPLKQYQGNGAWTEYAFTPQGWLQRLTHRRADGGILDQFTYAYTAAGQLERETDALGQVHRFVYDALGQLTEEYHPDLGAGGIQYRYDAGGNRRWVSRNGSVEYYGVDAADKLLWTNTAGDFAPTAGQTAPYSLFEYNAFGQMVRRDRKTAGGTRHVLDFLWDADGRLREVREGMNGLLSATYTADGERINRTDSVTGAHVSSFGLHDSNGNTTYTPGFAQRKNGSDRFFHSDWLGSTRYLTDGGLAAPSAARYDAYGNRSALGGTDGPHPTDYQYAGAWGYEREAEEALGLDYLYQRYYDPQVGKFISRDPIGHVGGLNLYGYVENDPVSAVDPLGLAKVYIVFKPLNWAGGTYGYHTTILVQDEVSVGPTATWYFRGGPSPGEGLKGVVKGRYYAKHGIYGPDTPDWGAFDKKKDWRLIKIIDDDKPASHYTDQLEALCSRVNRSPWLTYNWSGGPVDYWKTKWNSNTLARWMLEKITGTKRYGWPDQQDLENKYKISEFTPLAGWNKKPYPRIAR